MPARPSSAAGGAKCPCCGQDMPVTDELFISDSWRLLYRRGQKVCLTEFQFRVLRAVQDARYGITLQRLADVVYAHDPDGGPENTNASLHVVISKINHKLIPLGMSIARDQPFSWYSPYRVQL
jgi:hypothetical protein